MVACLVLLLCEFIVRNVVMMVVMVVMVVVVVFGTWSLGLCYHIVGVGILLG